MYAYFVDFYPLMSAYFQWRGRPEVWTSLGVGVVFVFLFLKFGIPLIPGRTGFMEFDGERLDFSGNSGGPWKLADVDSVIIQDRLIQIRVYRPGRMGNEFTAKGENMSAESWERLIALCRRIEAGMKPSILPQSNNLEEVA